MSSNAKPNKRTLDIQHNNKLQEFQQQGEYLTTLKCNYHKTLDDISVLEDKKKALSAEEQDSLLELCDLRDKYKREIESLESTEDELDYFMNTAPILFKYYDIVEKGNNEDVAPKVAEKSILNWFIKNKDTSNQPVKEDRAALLDRYMAYTDENYVKPIESNPNYICTCCNSANMNILLNDGIVFCNDCSSVEYIIVDHDRPSYKDPPKSLGGIVTVAKTVASHLPSYVAWCLAFLRKNSRSLPSITRGTLWV